MKENLESLLLNLARIQEKTNGNTNLFTLNGIPINQSKLNTNVDTVISFRWFTRKKKAGV